MWPAATIDEVLGRTAWASDNDLPGQERLVSLLFAPRDAAIWKELAYTRQDLDKVATNAWDLFFMGVPMVNRRELRAGHGYLWSDYLDFSALTTAHQEVSRHHRKAIRSSGLGKDPWKYRGGTEVVSLLYRGGQADWLSLAACEISSSDPESPPTLSQLTFRQKAWREGRTDPIFHSDSGLTAPGNLGLLQLDLTMRSSNPNSKPQGGHNP